MTIDYDHPFCCPVPRLSFQPNPGSAYFNAPQRAGYNPGYQPGDEPGHNGVDLNGALGSPSVAAHDGEIGWAGSYWRNPSAGKFVEVLELDVAAGGWWCTRALHHDTVTVTRGDRVVRGDKVGTVGKTGQAATPHVHFEIRFAPGLTANESYIPGRGIEFGVKLDPIGDPAGRWPGFDILADDCGVEPADIWPLPYLAPGDVNQACVPILASMLVILGFRQKANAGASKYRSGMVIDVRAAQEALAVQVDGKVGPETLDAMYAAVASTR